MESRDDQRRGAGNPAPATTYIILSRSGAGYLGSYKLSVMFRSSLDTSIKPILCPRKSGPTQKLITEQIPNDDDLLVSQPVTLQNNAKAILATRKEELDAAVANSDWETILTKSPVRESSALADIATALGFPKMRDYEKAVRHLLAEDDEALAFVRGLFDNLFDQLNG